MQDRARRRAADEADCMRTREVDRHTPTAGEVYPHSQVRDDDGLITTGRCWTFRVNEGRGGWGDGESSDVGVARLSGTGDWLARRAVRADREDQGRRFGLHDGG
ncbi:hypothetical protein GCM10027456_27990 [Kineosporia babensis]